MDYTGDRAAVLAIAKGETEIKGIPEKPITSAQRASEVWPPPAGFTVAEAQSYLDKGGWRALYNEAYGYVGNDLGNRPGTNDGSDFIGRGFIQITGRHNYKDIGRRMGLDFIKNPDLLNEKDISARAAITFMQRGGSPKDLESALVSVGGIKEGWPKKRRFYAEFKQLEAEGKLKLQSTNLEHGGIILGKKAESASKNISRYASYESGSEGSLTVVIPGSNTTIINKTSQVAASIGSGGSGENSYEFLEFIG